MRHSPLTLLLATVTLACGSGVQADKETTPDVAPEAGPTGAPDASGDAEAAKPGAVPPPTSPVEAGAITSPVDAGVDSGGAAGGGPVASADASPDTGRPKDAGVRHTPQEAAAEQDITSLRLCSWNLKKLGHGTTKDYPVVAEILDDECDVAVIIEVMQKGGTHPGYEDLLSALGSDWAGIVTDSPRPNTTSGSAEFYAVVWRTGHLDQCQGWAGLRYATDNDGSSVDAGADLFSREPAYGCFRMAGPAGQFDFLLAAYHAVWASGSLSTIQAEVGHIDAVVTEMKAARPGEDDILVLGDFNLVPSNLAGITSLTDWTIGAGSTLNSAGGITNNLYDHVLVLDVNATPEVGDKATVLTVTDRVADGEAFYSTVSDHLPVRVVLTVVGPDDD